MSWEDFSTWANKELHALENGLPAERPKEHFHSGDEVENTKYENNFKESVETHPNTATAQSHDKIANIAERKEIQHDFENKYDQINDIYSSKIAKAENKVELTERTLKQHQDNFLDSDRHLVKARDKLDVALKHHVEVEKNLKSLQEKYPNGKTMDKAVDKAQQSSNEADVKRGNIQSKLGNYYDVTNKDQNQTGVDAFKPEARQEHNKSIENSRLNEDKEPAWRDRLANKLESLGANKIADKVRGTSEPKIKQLSEEKNYADRFDKLSAAAEKATDPDLKDRLNAQVKFETASQNIENMKESIAAGQGGKFSRDTIKSYEFQRNTAAESMARADVKLSEKNLHVVMDGNNNPKLANGKHQHAENMKKAVDAIDQTRDVNKNLSNVKADARTIKDGQKDVDVAKAGVATAAHEFGVSKFDRNNDFRRQESSKVEVQLANAEVRGLHKEQQAALTDLENSHSGSPKNQALEDKTKSPEAQAKPEAQAEAKPDEQKTIENDIKQPSPEKVKSWKSSMLDVREQTERIKEEPQADKAKELEKQKDEDKTK